MKQKLDAAFTIAAMVAIGYALYKQQQMIDLLIVLAK